MGIVTPPVLFVCVLLVCIYVFGNMRMLLGRAHGNGRPRLVWPPSRAPTLNYVPPHPSASINAHHAHPSTPINPLDCVCFVVVHFEIFYVVCGGLA